MKTGTIPRLLFVLVALAVTIWLIWDFATDGPLDRAIFLHLFPSDRIALLAAIIGGFATLSAAGFGILGSYLAFMRTPRKMRRIELKLAYTEEQLSGLYGPLLGELKVAQSALRELLLRLNHTPDQVREILNGATPFNPYAYLGSRSDYEQKEWARFTRAFFLPGCARIVQLISTKQHLIGPLPMACLDQLLAHEAEYRIRFTIWEETAIPDSRPGATWPVDLQPKVEAKIAFLRLLQKKYRLQLANDEVTVAMRSSIQAYLAANPNPDPPPPVTTT